MNFLSIYVFHLYFFTCAIVRQCRLRVSIHSQAITNEWTLSAATRKIVLHFDHAKSKSFYFIFFKSIGNVASTIWSTNFIFKFILR